MIPVIQNADVLVVESTLAGCVAASKIARQGKKVVIASSGTSLAHEISICLRPWAQEDQLNAMPKEIASFLKSCVKHRTKDGELIFNVAKITRGLEDRLLDACVTIYYDVRPCGVVRVGRRISGVVFAGKAGLVIIGARAVVDCTQEAGIAAQAGVRLVDRKTRNGGLGVRYSMLCSERPPAMELLVEGVHEMVGGKIIFHGPFGRILHATRCEGRRRVSRCGACP